MTPAYIVLEWCFRPFYAILRAVPSALGGVLLMFGSIAVLFFLPWLDTSKVKSGSFRSVWFKVAFWAFAINAVWLGWLGSKPAEGWYIPAMQLGTAYYFAYFLIILPLLGLFETPKQIGRASCRERV